MTKASEAALSTAIRRCRTTQDTLIGTGRRPGSGLFKQPLREDNGWHERGIKNFDADAHLYEPEEHIEAYLLAAGPSWIPYYRGHGVGSVEVRHGLPAIWLGGGHPDALKRAAVIADGWMGAGGSSTPAFREYVPLVRAALETAGRDSATFPISKRVFLAVHERPEIARAEVHRWFSEVYPSTGGVFGTPEQVREQLEALVAMGANHLLLNPVTRYREQVEVLAEIVGLS